MHRDIYVLKTLSTSLEYLHFYVYFNKKGNMNLIGSLGLSIIT